MAAVFRTAARITAKAQYTDEYAAGNERVKVLMTVFENWVKACKKYLNALESLCIATQTSTNFSLEWCDQGSRAYPNFCGVLHTVEIVNQKLLTEKNNVKWRYTKDMLEPLETFLSVDMSTARRLKDEFRAVQLQVQNVERILNDLKSDKGIAKRAGELLTAEISYWEKFRDSERKLLASDHAIKDVLMRKEFEIADHFHSLLEAERDIAEAYSQEFQAFQHALDQAEEQAIATAKEAAAQSDARNMEAREIRFDRYERRWHELVRMLSSPDLVLIQSICSTAGSASDQTLETLIRILDAHHETLPLIKIGIQKETEGTTSEGSLFRGNSAATKLMSAFTRLTGRPYLHATLKDLITSVQSDPNGYEVDPSKTKSDESVEANMAKLLSVSENFLFTIIGSLDRCPLAFRYLARVLRTEVCRKFPDAKYSSVGGFLFLRFFCPAILAPESCGLMPGPPDKAVRRPLILIAKVLQNLSNNVRFGGKEAFMAPVNDFIDQHLPVLNEFFDQVVDVDEQLASDYPPLTNLEEVEQTQLPGIFKLLTENLEAVLKSLISWKNADSIPQLLTVLANLQAIQEQKPPSPFLSFSPDFAPSLQAPYLSPKFDFSSSTASPLSTSSSSSSLTASSFSPSTSSSSLSSSSSSSSLYPSSSSSSSSSSSTSSSFSSFSSTSSSSSSFSSSSSSSSSSSTTYDDQTISSGTSPSLTAIRGSRGGMQRTPSSPHMSRLSLAPSTPPRPPPARVNSIRMINSPLSVEPPSTPPPPVPVKPKPTPGQAAAAGRAGPAPRPPLREAFASEGHRSDSDLLSHASAFGSTPSHSLSFSSSPVMPPRPPARPPTSVLSSSSDAHPPYVPARGSSPVPVAAHAATDYSLEDTPSPSAAESAPYVHPRTPHPDSSPAEAFPSESSPPPVSRGRSVPSAMPIGRPPRIIRGRAAAPPLPPR